MKRIAKSFVKGALVLLPIAVTGYLVWTVLLFVDRLNPLADKVPGLGILITLLFITLVGLLASNVVGRKFIELLEGLLIRVPIVKILYGSLKDLMGAFGGEKKSFDKPVIVHLSADGAVKGLGFMTCERFDDPNLR